MAIPRFDYHAPDSFEALFALKGKLGEDARYVSGATALVLLMRAELVHPSALLAVAGLPGMRGVARTDGTIRIGAAMTHAELAASPDLRAAVPVLAETFAHVATQRVRNVGTVGGNLAHANPHQDPPTTLLALGASVVARGPAGERTIPLDDFFLDYFETALEPDEVLTGIEVPVPDPATGAAFVKFLPRSADDYATVNVAAILSCDGDRIAQARIVMGSMGPTPLRAPEAEAMLVGAAPDDALFRRAGAALAALADPEHDSRGTPEYKRQVAPVIVARALAAAWTRAGAGR